MSNFVHPTAIIYPNVEMGDNNYIGPYCVIGAPAESRGNWGAQGKVIIGNNNRFTGLVTIDGGMEDVEWGDGGIGGWGIWEWGLGGRWDSWGYL